MAETVIDKRERLSDVEFTAMAERFAPIANRIARKFSRDDEAESVARLAMLQAIRKSETRPAAIRQHFVTRCIINAVFDHIRRYRTACRRGLEGGCEFIEQVPDNRAAWSEKLPEYFRKLPGQLRAVAAARWWEDESLKSIAQKFNVDESTVKRRLKRARKMICLQLENPHEPHATANRS